MQKCLLWLLGTFLTLLEIARNPMFAVFPMWIFTNLTELPEEWQEGFRALPDKGSAAPGTSTPNGKPR